MSGLVLRASTSLHLAGTSAEFRGIVRALEESLGDQYLTALSFANVPPDPLALV